MNLPLLHGGRYTWDEFLITFVITFGLAGFVYALTRIRERHTPDDDPDLPQPDG
jgi:hypothetical protein